MVARARPSGPLLFLILRMRVDWELGLENGKLGLENGLGNRTLAQGDDPWMHVCTCERVCADGFG